MLSCVLLPNIKMFMIAVLQQGAATHQVPGFDVFFGAVSASPSHLYACSPYMYWTNVCDGARISHSLL